MMKSMTTQSSKRRKLPQVPIFNGSSTANNFIKTPLASKRREKKQIPAQAAGLNQCGSCQGAIVSLVSHDLTGIEKQPIQCIRCEAMLHGTERCIDSEFKFCIACREQFEDYKRETTCFKGLNREE